MQKFSAAGFFCFFLIFFIFYDVVVYGGLIIDFATYCLFFELCYYLYLLIYLSAAKRSYNLKVKEAIQIKERTRKIFVIK